MIFTELAVSGAFAIEVEPHRDDRGLFARAFDADDLEARGLVGSMRQGNLGFSPAPGTMRGMHFQRAPHAEVKLVRCTAGSAFDVIADLRPDSPTRGRWAGVVIDALARNLVYVPEGVAHGYLTLEPDTEVFYLTSHSYAPDAASGMRYDDPAFDIELPRGVEVISAADRSWPDVTL
jgi:dTDP-4-dehydrorhamnose 3,5-epimerase